MSLIPGITPISPVIGDELDGDTFAVVAGQYRPKFDPASTTAITIGPAGIKVNAPAPVLDGNDRHITRADAIPNVAPTATEAPSPINGDTAKVRLSDGAIEYWSFTTVWAKNFTALAPAAPIDETVDVAGATLPITFPVTTIPGTPVFTPSTPATANLLYVFPNGQTAVWNGTQYAAYVAPGRDYFSNVTATANTLSPPDGVNDLTEAIRRDGNLGLVTNPLSTLDVNGSFGLKVRNLSVAATAVVVANNDSILAWSGAGEQLVTLPSAALFPRRIVTLRTLAEATVLKVSAVAGNVEHPDFPLSAVVEMKGLAVRSATWQSDSANWRLIDWTKPAYYPTAGYTAPPGSASVNSLALPVPAAGVPTQLPNTISSFVTADGNYAALVALPASKNSTGRYSFYSGASFATQVATANTDLPVVTNITTGQSIHFEWSDGLWRWVPAPEPSAPATTNTATWTRTAGITETVNGVAANIAIPAATPNTIVDFIGYNTLGNPINVPVPRTPRVLEEYKAVAASATHAVIGPNLDSLYDTYFVSTTIEVTAPGVTYTLPVIPAALNLLRIEIDVKCLGAWTGTVSVVPGAGSTIDALASYSFNKVAATGVNAFPSRKFKYANSRWFVV